jgi:hypothetical protein
MANVAALMVDKIKKDNNLKYGSFLHCLTGGRRLILFLIRQTNGTGDHYVHDF